MTRNIDELNNLNTRAEEPEEYFAKMDLPKKEKQRRVEFTKKANEIFDLILVMLLLSDYRDFELYESLRKRLEGYLLALIAEFTTPDDYLIDYASSAADNFIEATKKNESNEWFFSADRALYNAENSANDVLNYDLYMQAIADGKTHKRWITEKDNRVRLSHKLLDGKTIEIRKLFYPGGVPMRFPKDYEYAEAFPRELIGCRCSIKYLPEDKEDEKDAKSKQNRVENYASNGILKERNNVAFYGEPIHRSLGAKTRDYPNAVNPFTGEPLDYVPESRPEYPPDHLLAGKGSKKPIDIIDYLVDTYGGEPKDWKHEKAFFQVYDETGDIRQVSIHWFDCGDGLRHEEKVKVYNGAMYRDEYDDFEKYF